MGLFFQIGKGSRGKEMFIFKLTGEAFGEKVVNKLRFQEKVQPHLESDFGLRQS